MLELKLSEMGDHVDYFVIGEATRTFKGIPKSLYLKDTWDRFAKWHHKIRRIEITTPADLDPWKNEINDREELQRGLFDADPDDIIMLSDCDEISKQSALEHLRADTPDNESYYQMIVPQYYFKLNYLQKSYWTADKIKVRWYSPFFAIRRKYVKDLCALRDLARHTDKLEEQGIEFSRVWNAGWHFSFVGNDEFIQNKVSNFDYTWLGEIGPLKSRTNTITSSIYEQQPSPTKIIDSKILNREGFTDKEDFEPCALDDWMPITVLNNLDRWKDWLIFQPNLRTASDILADPL
jgi:hypothetical protein